MEFWKGSFGDFLLLQRGSKVSPGKIYVYYWRGGLTTWYIAWDLLIPAPKLVNWFNMGIFG